jgi:hypothetical protein
LPDALFACLFTPQICGTIVNAIKKVQQKILAIDNLMDAPQSVVRAWQIQAQSQWRAHPGH